MYDVCKKGVLCAGLERHSGLVSDVIYLKNGMVAPLGGDTFFLTLREQTKMDRRMVA